MRKKWFPILLSALLVLSLAACAEKDSAANSSTTQPVDESSVEMETSAADQLTVRFGNSGAPFTMYLEDNDTAAAIAM